MNFSMTMDNNISDPGSLKLSQDVNQIEWKIYFPFNFMTSESKFADSYESTVFSFSNSAWRLKMRPQCEKCPEFYSLQLLGARCPKPIEYQFGLKKLDDSVELLDSGILEEFGLESKCHNALNIPDILQRKDELTDGTSLTIVCILTQGTALNFKSSEKRNFTSLEELDALSEDYKNFFTDEDSCDIILKVDEKVYKAHKSVLIARSSVFAAMFRHNSSENQTGTIEIPDCDSDSYHDFLMFLYTGKLTIVSYSQAICLYQTSDKYDVQGLKQFCVKYLMHSLTIESICPIAQLAHKYEERELFFEAQDFFNKNLPKIFESSEWQRFFMCGSLFANELLKNMSSKIKIVD